MSMMGEKEPQTSVRYIEEAYIFLFESKFSHVPLKKEAIGSGIVSPS